MSDPLGGRPEQERASRTPDFFDRLLARHTPAAVPPADVVRLRPRLAGPFERAEAVRATAPEPDATGPLWPAAPQPGLTATDLAGPTVREVQLRTERERTVVQAGRPVSEGSAPRPLPRELPEAPLLRPAAGAVPASRPVPDSVRRSAGRAAPERDSSPSAVPAPLPPDAGVASPAAVSAAPRPGAADTAAAREAVRQATGRRSGRGREQVVQVQIGRLEVTAAGATPADGGRRPTAPGRPAATVSLADYLARGRE
ncbi:hypothetical protein [Streptomyces sp. NPDC060205]|uniref:hypothetical protein n=1 Tax=Streptomyces sp. NPDC060205 TaxID=3347072 RepID=UPI00364F2192